MKNYKLPGLKLTPQRLAILQYLEGNKEHPSADEIYRVVSKKFPTMSMATVYNTLETLRKRGHLVELNVDPYKKRFDPDPKPHHHLICTKCNKITDVHYEFPLPLSNLERDGFQIIGSHIEFYGICPKCKK